MSLVRPCGILQHSSSEIGNFPRNRETLGMNPLKFFSDALVTLENDTKL